MVVPRTCVICAGGGDVIFTKLGRVIRGPDEDDDDAESELSCSRSTARPLISGASMASETSRYRILRFIIPGRKGKKNAHLLDFDTNGQFFSSLFLEMVRSMKFSF